jgi:hypothetical protein
MSKLASILFLLALPAIGSAYAQAPTGTIAGVVRDPSGAVVTGAQVKLVSLATGLTRTASTSERGDYSFPALLAGEYEVSTELQGFRRIVRQATVEAGATTTTDLELVVGDMKDSITVDGASPQIHYDSHTVGGLITQSQIQDLPLNGRSFLELAKLEPGVQPPTRGTSNRTFVPALGQPLGSNPGRGTRVTIDGGSIMALGNGGSAMGLSQEVVQEFQISTVSFDLSTGATDGAAINVVTRSGGNDLHGAGLYVFRDHNLAAYPALSRDSTNPDPFFQRRQFGFALGGPIRRDRVFFFVNWERNEQRGVVATKLLGDFANLSRITPSPYFGTQLSLRLDGRLSNAHTAFIRYSHDGVRAFGPAAFQPNAYPSAWLSQPSWADQSILGLTSVLRDTVVNDLRFSYFFISSSQVEATESDCPGCQGIGAPSITVGQGQAALIIGRPVIQHNLGRRFHLSDSVTWQRGTHRARFGVDWEHNRGGLLVWNNEPATLTLFSPNLVRNYNFSPQTPPQLRIALPSAFNTLSDILKLPLQTVTVGIGDPRVAQENGSLVRTWNTARLFFQDTWRLNSRLNLNYGLGWSIDRNLNYDLTKPALLAPILGADGLGPTRRQWKNFSPVLGLAWSPWRDGKTVFRAGAGVFYDFLFSPILDIERALLGPPGSGRQNISVTSISNCRGVPAGTALRFPASTPTLFTGEDLLSCLPAIQAELIQKLANADTSIQAIQLSKQASGLTPVDVPRSSALHVNLGIQREIARDFVVSADFAYRHFIHLGLGQLGQIDLNHFNSARGPVIPRCADAQRSDPNALCSTGPINVQTAAGRATYKGLLLRAEKRFSHGFQILGSWAYSSNTGNNSGNGFNQDDWLSNRGPLPTDFTHIVNLAGVTRLPWQFQLGLNFSYSSAPPFSAFVGQIDLNGDGSIGDLLPGTTVNAFNRGMGRADLQRLVAQFNQTYAGRVGGDAKGAPIPKLMLPDRYWFGDNYQSLDLRVSRSFSFRDRWRLLLIGEAFNLYNAANLSDYSGDLANNLTFGQPISRATQVFGSGGPRAFQLGARVTF